MDDYSISGYRIYSKAFNLNQGSQSFTQIYDANWVWSNGTNVNTGAWRPLFPTDFNANIDITGLTVSVGAVAITGAPVVTLTGNQNVNIVNPVLAVSGSLSASIDSVAITGSPVVTLTGTQNTNVTNPILAISGFIASPQSTNLPNQTLSGGNGLALPANAIRKKWFLQNIATGNSPLFVGMGVQSSDKSFNMVLGPSSNQWAGDGGIFIDDKTPFTGSVYVSGINNVNYVIWELA